MQKVLDDYNELLESSHRKCMGKCGYTQSIIIDLTHFISFELRRVIDENACKELLNLIPAKKIVQRAQRESNANLKQKFMFFAIPSMHLCQHDWSQLVKYYTLIT